MELLIWLGDAEELLTPASNEGAIHVEQLNRVSLPAKTAVLPISGQRIRCLTSQDALHSAVPRTFQAAAA